MGEATAAPHDGDGSDEVEDGAVGIVSTGETNASEGATGSDQAGGAAADTVGKGGGMPADDAPIAWPDDAAESAFLAEARERGETVAPAKVREELVEEADAKALPPLQELVEKIPAEVRETLEELFRARFTTVKRVPKKALKR